MKRLRKPRWAVVCLAAALWISFSIVAPRQTAEAQSGHPLLGGARGVVRNADTGAALEGIMVQIISRKNSIRTTVYSNAEGRYEFPKLEAGVYTLRIAKPLEFRPYVRESVPINGSLQLEDIELVRVTDSEFLPPTPDILPQLTDSEWVYNLSGTAQQKKVFSNACGTGCHTYQWIFRSRFDERSWRLIVERMLNYSGRIKVFRRPADRPSSYPPAQQAMIAKWLAEVRGPESENPHFKVFPRAWGPATRAIVTEYELPTLDTRPHDVIGDSKGNIWYTSNRRPYLGKLDPRTGIVTEYKVPNTPGKHTGQHWLGVGKDDVIWYSETWANNLVKFDPRTEEFKVMPGWSGNMEMDPEGFIWRTNRGKIHKIDPETGKSVQQFQMQRARSTYGNFISWDGKYFAGGSRGIEFDGVVFLDIGTGEVVEVESHSGVSGASRGGFDPDGNAWVGGRGGVILKYDRRTRQVTEYTPPTPYTTMYEAKPDKNGEVWAGEMRSGRIARFNPRTGRWIEYVMPEPYSLDWRTWIDNSTDPVTVWYGEHNGYIVRLQLLD